MHIGFDGKRIVQNYTGLGNYSRYVLNILASNFPDNSYTIYSPREPSVAQPIFNKRSVSLKTPGKTFSKAYWRTFDIVKDLKRDGVELYHGLSNEIPVGLKKAGIPCVVTIHDLIFLRYPHYYSFIDRKIYEWKVSYVCKNADRIIAVSEQTKKDLVSYFNIDEGRIDVVFQNCNQLYTQEATTADKERVRNQYRLPPKFLLNVGTIEKRKNLALIIKALKSIPEDVHLVAIGRPTDYASELKKLIKVNRVKDRVHFLTNVPLADLPAIYQQAEIFIYPSEYEGFGIPVVEALHSRVPIIAATGSCLEEAGGPGACYVHPKDQVQLAYCVNSILNNSDKRSEMIKLGESHLDKFRDEKLSADLIKVYRNTLYDA